MSQLWMFSFPDVHAAFTRRQFIPVIVALTFPTNKECFPTLNRKNCTTSSVVQRSLLVVSYSGPSSVSVGGLCVAACIYVAEFNRVGLQRKSVLNRAVLEMLLTNTVGTTM